MTNVRLCLVCVLIIINQFVEKAHLITRRTPRFQKLCMMSTAVDLAIVVKIDEVHQKLIAGGASKACRMPTRPRTRS